MGIDFKQYKRITLPYRREALYCLLIDFIIIVLSSMTFYLVNVPWQLYLMLPTYLLFECVANYRISILLHVEQSLKQIKTCNVVITQLTEDCSGSGWLWNSILPKLYPKEINMQRYWIVCKTENGKVLRIRSAMSERKAKIITDVFINAEPYIITLMHGRFSRILYLYSNSRKQTKGNMKNIYDDAVRTINNIE